MKENLLEFYINGFNYLDNTEDIDLSFVPPILKRRMSALDKITVFILNKTYSEDIQNIVFSSQFGEVDRLLKIIEQYTYNDEVSPNTFSSSVHNFPVGFFLLNRQKPLPYNAVSGMQNSISGGLLTSLISNYDNILYCYCDVNKGKVSSFALNISKFKKENSDKYRAVINNIDKPDDFDSYIKLFSGGINNLETAFFKLERLSHD